MKKVLVVGYLDYEKYKSLCEKYKDILFVEAMSIRYDGVNALIELVGMFDEVMFVGECNERFPFEVACAMMKKDVCEFFDCMLADEKERGKNNAETL